MIDYEIFHKIKHYHEQRGLTAPQIAKELEIDVRTVIKWLKEEGFRPRKASQKTSKIEPYRDEIIRMLETHPYTATQVFQRIQEQGFDGGYWIVKNFVRKVRPKPAKAFLSLAFAPGECAQVDWGSYGSVDVGSTRRRLSFFVMVLCHSRLMYLEFTVSQTMEHFLACHQNAFEFFGGVPKKIMVDNLRSAVLKRVAGEAPVFNPKYLDFAHHHGFTITPCAVAKGNEKGRVENGVGYVKKNFLSGLDIPYFEALNPAARNWMDTIANVRTHGETREKPLERFNEQEKNAMSPLNRNLYDIGTIHQVRASSQFRITVDTNRYSVPAQYASTKLTLKSYHDRLCIYDEGRLIARHPRSYDRHKDYEDSDHPRELIRQRRNAREQKIYARFISLSRRAEEYYRQLEERRMNPRVHVTKIVALSEIHGEKAVAAAMDDAFEFLAFSSEYIANILEQRANIKPQPGTLILTRRQDLLDLEVQQPDLSIYAVSSQTTKE